MAVLVRVNQHHALLEKLEIDGVGAEERLTKLDNLQTAVVYLRKRIIKKTTHPLFPDTIMIEDLLIEED